jgi:hypothetical protein
LDTHSTERDIKAEQHHVPPDMPDDPEALEHEKRNVVGVNVATIAALVAVFVIVIIVAIAIL